MNQPAALITSGAYVSAEISAELGRIPPTFLPLGNRRLYHWQLAEFVRAGLFGRRLISLPDDFEVPALDAAALAASGVEVVRTPPNMTLGEAVGRVIESHGLCGAPLYLHHGDTLLRGREDMGLDVVSTGLTRAYYPWADYIEEGGRLFIGPAPPSATERSVLTGGFTFADPSRLLAALSQPEATFVTAIETYSKERPMRCDDSGDWFDFGHLQTYFQSKQRMTTQRHFNQLEAMDSFFLKSSSNSAKISAEKAWFQGLPDDLRIYSPLVLAANHEAGVSAYKIEYLPLPTLSELYVFGRLPVSVWRGVLSACSRFLEEAARHSRPATSPDSWRSFYLDKTLSRLDQYAKSKNLDVHAQWTLNGAVIPSLHSIAYDMANRVGASNADDCIVHGDFCFSNILYDFRTDRIKVIDPRGQDANGVETPYGDARYETGKLHHSIIGMYDHILAGRYVLRAASPYVMDFHLTDAPQVADIQELFLQTRFAGRSIQDMRAVEISVLLFLSMLPLHADDSNRQAALLANALRLHQGIPAS